MTPPRSRIALQLAVALALMLVLLISISTLFALRSLNSANLVTRAEHLGSEARLLADQLDTFHGSLRDSTQRLLGCSSSASVAACRCATMSALPSAACSPRRSTVGRRDSTTTSVKSTTSLA